MAAAKNVDVKCSCQLGFIKR